MLTDGSYVLIVFTVCMIKLCLCPVLSSLRAVTFSFSYHFLDLIVLFSKSASDKCIYSRI